MKLKTLLCVLVGALSVVAEDSAASKAEEAVVREEETEVSSDSSGSQGFERYKTITDRMPFGPEPSGFNPDAPPGSSPKGGAAAGDKGGMDEVQRSEEEMKILSSVRVSVLNVTPSGKIAVGFTDSSRQPSANYYLKVGESRDGWTVKEADPREMTVVLANQDGVEATLKLGETAGGDAKGGKKGREAPPRRRGVALQESRLQNQNEAVAPGDALASLRARRQQREAEAAEERARQAAAAAEERKEREQAAADRAQQREALYQLQETLRHQLEVREQQRQQEQQAQPETEG